jgi:inhibitor of cysteine peptidase
MSTLQLDAHLWQRIGIGLFLVFLVTACGPSGAAGTPSDELAYGTADVEEVTVQLMESFPVQVAVVAQGHLRDGCTEIHEVKSSFDEENRTFSVEITTVRERDAVCTQALVPFEKRIELDVRGLRAGTYSVDVNGVREAFTLDVDNELPQS